MRTFFSGLFGSTRRAQAALLALAFMLSGVFALADQSVVLVNGTTITISVTADGTAPFTYQWKKGGVNLANGGNIAGVTTSSLVLSNVTAADLGSYTVLVTNGSGSTTSDQALISAAVVFPPAITSQPSSQTVLVGDDVSLSVTASGSVPLAYQWKKNGVNVPGATSATLSIDPVALTDFGSYTVVVSNSGGSVESGVALITDATVPPFFATSLASQTTTTGSTVSFSISPSGTPPITYQWQRNGLNLANGAGISGVNTTTLTLTGVTSAANNGTYTLVATNSAASTASNGATLNVITPPPTTQAPVFIVSPIPKTAAAGDTVIFVAEVTANPAATYQWQKNGADLANIGKFSGTNTPILTIYNVSASDAATYRLVATNTVGSATSSGAELKVNTTQPPLFTTQPASQTALTGQAVFFTVVTSAYPVPTYRWRKNGVNLSNGGNVTGATSTTLAISNVTTADVASYSVVATNSGGTTASADATLSINGTPAILSQPPVLSIVNAGSIVNLAVTVTGDPAPTLQWRKNGTALANGGIVTGATSSSLTLSGVSSADAGKYSVVVTNSRGTVTSPDFELSVLAGNVSNQPATTGKDVALSAPDATGSVQWQVSNDAGATWTNVTNGGSYSGATTNTLHIAAVTSALNTSLFRLVTSGTTTVLFSGRLSVTEAFLPFPVSLSADASGNLYVADASNDTIGKINLSTQITVHAGTNGQTGTADGTGAAARFNDPSGVASSSDGTLAVADKANATIRLISPTGVVTTLAGSTTLRGNVDGTGSSATFSAPLGVTRDSAGNYYVADSMNHTIRKVTSAGVVTTLAGSAGQAGTADGTGTAARFNNPTGLDVDQGGILYVADTTNNLIRKVSPTGVVTTLAGLGGVAGITDGTGANALFNQPTGVAVDASGNVYVADTGSSTIRRITPAGAVTTIAGLPGIAGHKDGSGLGAWFNQPRDVAVSSTGFLYVADTGNASIRRIDQSGAVTTLALTALPSTDNQPNQPLPETPTLPTTPTVPTVPSTPTLPTSPTPPTTSSGGGGGGATSLWFPAILGALWLMRRRSARNF